jgi:outer membrane receptor protein involved in Fe transport
MLSPRQAVGLLRDCNRLSVLGGTFDKRYIGRIACLGLRHDLSDLDQAEILYANGYAIRRLKGSYRPMEGLGFFVEGRNLSDKTYVATTGVIADAQGRDSAQFLPGDGRSLYVGLEWRL